MNTEDALQFRINRSGIAELDLPCISSWDGFDYIVRFMREIYSAEIKDSLDGIDTRSVTIIVKKNEFKLLHDDMFGSTIIAENSSGNDLLKEIYQEMRLRLS